MLPVQLSYLFWGKLFFSHKSVPIRFHIINCTSTSIHCCSRSNILPLFSCKWKYSNLEPIAPLSIFRLFLSYQFLSSMTVTKNSLALRRPIILNSTNQHSFGFTATITSWIDQPTLFPALRRRPSYSHHFYGVKIPEISNGSHFVVAVHCPLSTTNDRCRWPILIFLPTHWPITSC